MAKDLSFSLEVLWHIVRVKDELVIPRVRYRPYRILADGTIVVDSFSGNYWSSVAWVFSRDTENTRELLLRLRAKLEWSRAKMAAFLGTPVDTLRRWEDGSRQPSTSARRLVWIFDCLVSAPEKLRDPYSFVSWGKLRSDSKTDGKAETDSASAQTDSPKS